MCSLAVPGTGVALPPVSGACNKPLLFPRDQKAFPSATARKSGRPGASATLTADPPDTGTVQIWLMFLTMVYQITWPSPTVKPVANPVTLAGAITFVIFLV